jgi:hypothetical protein
MFGEVNSPLYENTATKAVASAFTKRQISEIQLGTNEFGTKSGTRLKTLGNQGAQAFLSLPKGKRFQGFNLYASVYIAAAKRNAEGGNIAGR